MAKIPEIRQQNLARNILINGDFDFFQRYLTQDIDENARYTADRFVMSRSNALPALNVRASRDFDVPTFEESGHRSVSSLRLEVLTADSWAIPNTVFALGQWVEGFNIRPFIGALVRVSVWVKTNVTGIYSLTVHAGDFNDSYVQDVEITQADTWTKCSVLVPLDSNRGWGITTGRGAFVDFKLNCSNEFVAVENGVWANVNRGYSTNHSRIFGTQVGHYIQFSQFLVTPDTQDNVPFRRYGTNIEQEFAACQRYFEKSYQTFTPLQTVTNRGQEDYKVTGTNNMYGTLNFRVSKRDIPTPAFYSPVDGAIGFGQNGGNKPMTAFSGPTNENRMAWQMATATANTEMAFHWSADAEL